MIEEKIEFIKISKSFIENMKYLTPTSIMIYIYLKSRVNKKITKDQPKNQISISYQEISNGTGISQRTISKAIIELIKFGWISNIEKVFGSANKYTVNDIVKFKDIKVTIEIKSENENESENIIVIEKDKN